MAKKKSAGKSTERVRRGRHLSAAEAKRVEVLRKQSQSDFPPAKKQRPRVPTTGLAADLRRARKSQGLSWYAVAKRAGIPNPNTVRDIEQGADARLSNIEAVAKVLGLKIEARSV